MDCVEDEMLLTQGMAGALAVACLIVAAPQARAETLESALVKAYGNNPQLNAQRASVRATDEGVSKAQAGYRPKLTASADIGAQYLNNRLPNPVFGLPGNPTRTIITPFQNVPRG